MTYKADKKNRERRPEKSHARAQNAKGSEPYRKSNELPCLSDIIINRLKTLGAIFSPRPTRRIKLRIPSSSRFPLNWIGVSESELLKKCSVGYEFSLNCTREKGKKIKLRERK